jgi:hypothetical protein
VPVPAAAPMSAAAPQPAGSGTRGGTRARTGGLAAGARVRALHRHHLSAAPPRVLPRGATHVVRPAAAPLAALSSRPAAAGAQAPRRYVGTRARHGADHRRPEVTRAPRRAPPSPVDLAPVAASAAAGVGGPGGGTMLALALVAALLLSGPAGPYELVAQLRRRAPAGLGGRLERPG